MNIYSSFCSKNKKFALLIDPDKVNAKDVENISGIAQKAFADYIFVGGSLLTNDNFDNCISTIKQSCSVPVVLFPGNTLQINDKADAILFLSLISGRNAEMLIGKHVIVAPYLKKSSLEIIPTGYMLIDGGKPATALYMSNSMPIPHDKGDVAMCTAMAGEMLGFKTIYMDAGSGALNHISESMVSVVKNNVSIPLIIGGGIKTPDVAAKLCKAGADIIVVGNAIEKDKNLITSVSEAVHAV